MSVCTKTLTLSLGATDMPLDQAIYHPTRGTLFAVRGGRIYELSLAGGILQQADYTSGFGLGTLAYDSGSDKIFAACWNTPQFGINLGASIGPRTIYRIVPSTLAVDATYDLATLFSLGLNVYCLRGTGITQLFANGGWIYFSLLEGSNTGAENSYLGRFSAATPGTQFKLIVSRGGWMEIGYGSVAGADTLFVTDQTNLALQGYNFTGSSTIPETGALGTKIPIGVAYSSISNSVYVTSQTQFIYVLDVAFAAITATINTGRSAFNGLRIRNNPNDGLLYASGYGDNTVAVINPAGNTVTIKTGFDLPLDIVFTPTQKFAVQQGATGIKEIV